MVFVAKLFPESSYMSNIQFKTLKTENWTMTWNSRKRKTVILEKAHSICFYNVTFIITVFILFKISYH